jgi:hypothetical protein
LKRETFAAFLPFFFSMLLFLSFFQKGQTYFFTQKCFENVLGEKNFFSNFLSNGKEVATPRFMKWGELWKIYGRWMRTPEMTDAR